jgi:hypothetical protein
VARLDGIAQVEVGRITFPQVLKGSHNGSEYQLEQ